MGTVLKSLLTTVFTCVLASAVLCATASADDGTSPGVIAASLVVPSADQLIAGDQERAANEARREDPGAVAARAASRVLFENLSARRAADIAGSSFPDLVRGNDGSPRLPDGSQILDYPTDNAMEVSLPGGEGTAVVESLAPLATNAPDRKRAPLDLSLRQEDDSFDAVRPAVSVDFPRDLSRGVAIPGVGVSITPTDAQGHPLGMSEGARSGTAAVLWGPINDPASSAADTSTIATATPMGFDLTTVLYSERSPRELYFHVNMPSGAELRTLPDGTVEIAHGDRTLAVLPPVSAQDADGTIVPATMRVRGDGLEVNLDLGNNVDPLFPIAVDPELNDAQLTETSAGRHSNWEFYSSNSSRFQNSAVNEGPGLEHLETKGIAEYAPTDWAYWGYQTKGVSHIYELKTQTSARNKGAKIESFLEFEEHGGARETRKSLSNEYESPEYENKPTTICAANAAKAEECLPGSGMPANAVHFQQSATGSPGANYGFSDKMTQGIVSIAEPPGTHSTTGYNTASPMLEFEAEVEGKKQKLVRQNALYGTGSWLTHFNGALQLNAADSGIGVSATKLEYESSVGKWSQLVAHDYLGVENACRGVQCYEGHSEFTTLPSGLPDGQQKLRYSAEEAISGTKSLESEGRVSVKVDTAAPHDLEIDGLPFGNELSERPYTLQGEATDGEGVTVASSGIKALSLFIDGHEFGTAGGLCSTPKGECSASRKWTVNGAELGAGKHDIALVAVDNAGNEARLYEPITIRHSTPVAVGPGSVDLESGDFSLGANDVSFGSGLTVARNYSSRAVEAGNDGPLGPQWSLSTTNTESLVQLVDGGVLMTAANGSQVIFARPGAGAKCEVANPFESPQGDSNLKLWCTENKTTKAREAYFLENVAARTKVKFTLPSGDTKDWVPTVQEGPVATDTVTYKYQTAWQWTQFPTGSGNEPRGITEGSDGNVWYANLGGDRIGKMTVAGVATEYPISHALPLGITQGPDGNIWYTTCGESPTIGKMTTSGTSTEYLLPTGSSCGVEITAGPDGNLWFSESEANKIGRITTSGVITEYPLPASSQPWGIAAGPDGNLWFAEHKTNKIGRITIAGGLTEFALPAQSEPRGITAGPDGNLWFTESNPLKGKGRIGKITPAGGVITEYPSVADGPVNIIPAPDGNLWFTAGGTNIGRVTTSGVVTLYPLAIANTSSLAIGADGNIWYPGTSWLGRVTTAGVLTEPTEALAPVPSGVSCSWSAKPTEMQPGCRALEFQYSSSTTATGEGRAQWGEYRSRLNRVNLVAYDPASKEMREVAVAAYQYDKDGRLRAAWDPRVSPALKTSYGYDPEDHLTALSPSGQEPWSLSYGVAVGDKGTGRLLKVNRASATVGLWNGEQLKSTLAPQVSGKATVGTRLAVSTGTWAPTPLTYGYQWQECDAAGHCSAISGATNANYTPTHSNLGHSLSVLVTATNGGGSSVAVTAPTSVVSSGAVTQTIDSPNSLTAVSCIPATARCVATDSEGEVFYSMNVTTTGSATWKQWFGPGPWPSTAIACPATSLCLVAAGGNLYYASSFGGAWAEAYAPSYGVDALSCVSASFCVDGQNGGGFFRYSTAPASTSWTLESQGAGAMRGVSCLSTAFCTLVDSEGNVYVAKTTAQIESSTWTSSHVDSVPLNGSACTSSTSCVAIDGSGNVLNLTISGTGSATAVKHKLVGAGSLSAISCPTSALCIVVDNKGSVFVSTNGGESWTVPYGFGDNLTSLTCASAALCLTADTVGTVTAFAPTASGEGEARAPEPGVTVEYGVPVTGSGAPHDLSTAEVTKWGQADDPVEATAIFPTDEPQGWPASSYKRASIYYLDEQGREVNRARPSSSTYGSVSTTEYNEFNDVIRTLSPDNRATALAAGAGSVERSKQLDTQSTFNGEAAKEGEVSEPGTLLIEMLGPQHQVKYHVGGETKESLARDHTKFVYDQGAPGGETYRLLTEEYDLAQLANHEEVEVRTTRKSYSGQANLGWKLRAPTSVTLDPEGLSSTITTEYNPTTAQITEVRGAGAEKTLAYATKFGEVGTEAGKLKNPWGVAVNSEGKLWVVDRANNRVEQFSSAGAYLTKFGETGSGDGQLKEPQGIALDAAGHVWVADTGNSRLEEFSSTGTFIASVGSLGTESGKFKAPSALAFDTKGNLWAADTGNSRIEKFDKEAKYVSEFSSLGSEPGKLKEPRGIAIDSGEHVWVADTGNNRIQEFSAAGSLLKRFGAPGTGEGQLNTPLDLKIDSSGNIWTVDSANSRVESFSTSGAYVTQIGFKGTEAGQLTEPGSLAFDAAGKAWVSDAANNRLEQWSKGANAHDQRIIYYSTAADAEYPTCGSHPEWVGLICEALPTKQPELMGLPKLPVTVTTYNIFNEPETITETFGATTRTKKETYDAGGRKNTSEVTASTGVSLPKVKFAYNSELGVLEKQSTEGAEPRTLTSEFNRLGQLVKYTDADGNIAKYKYAGPEGDFLPEEASDSSAAGTSKQTYEYDATTKLRTKLIDSAAGTLTASYDAEGRITSVSYPYSMCANYAYNAVGEATSVSYLKSSTCSESEAGTYYTNTRLSSVHGEMLGQTSTLASDNYVYDSAGRLTETQETPTGEGCTVRAYAYDEGGNRASSASRTPGVGGACQAESGMVEGHNYDEAGRLADGGLSYDGLSNVTKLPATDAEGKELTSTFYVDNAIATQTQGGVTNEYKLDPEGRTREITTGAAKTKSHYDGPGEAIAWTENAEQWIRNIPGIDGTLLATQANGATPVIQLHDLQGDVVGTIGDKAGETKLLSTYNSTEFGVPNAGKAPPKFAWLGAFGVESSFSTGVITYGATSYVPQTGRALQSEAVEPPGLSGGSGSGAPYTMQEEPWNMQGAARAGAEAPGLEAAREQEALEAALNAAVDPPKTEELSLADARIKGEAFLKIASAAEVINAIGSIPEKFVDKIAGLIWDKFTVDFALDWYHKAGKKLLHCSYLYDHGIRECRFTYDEFFVGVHTPLGDVGFTIVNLFVPPEVGKCFPALVWIGKRPMVCVSLQTPVNLK
jgi:streptogramin lyase